MAVIPCSMLYLSMTCLVCLQLTGACESDRRCPGSKRCCNGICRFSCTCISSSDCDWDEKCCADQTCIDALDMCPQRIPVYVIAMGVFSVAFVAFLCLALVCYRVRSCPWNRRRIAWRRRHEANDTLQRSHFTTLARTNLIQELDFPDTPPPLNFSPSSYSPPLLTGNPAKYTSFTVQRTCQPATYSPLRWSSIILVNKHSYHRSTTVNLACNWREKSNCLAKNRRQF